MVDKEFVKKKREYSETDWTTVNVSNVPLDTQRGQLEAAFSDVGPIKKCFVVKGRPGSTSTIGFVTFAMHVDATAALSRRDLKIGDNSLKLKLAPNTKLKDRKGGKKEVGGRKVIEEKGKMRGNPRKARLIVRNLSFKSTEKNMRQTFKQFGEISEINILKKPDGKLVGCAFIQYTNPNHAAKAIKELNAKDFLGRPIAVDWAVPKEVFKETKEEVKDEVKEELDEVKDEPESDDDEEEVKNEIKSEEDDESMDDEDDDDEDDDDDDDDEKEQKPRVAHNLSTGHDIDEGKTVFIKNLAYETDEEDLREMMSELFGPVHFAKLVLDKIMQHPRGTGFVKFVNVEDAAKCVEVSQGKDGIFLDKRQLNCCIAIKQGDVAVAQDERKKKEVKDNRNLYLAREGAIREGTKAAEGVSGSDLEKRKEVDRQKKNMLKSLNMFVSDTRLCVRNLPVSWDDKKLRKLFLENAPQNARIKEAKIIRDMKQMENGVGLSKQFGFVAFNKHEDALAALRNINNNPEIFGAEHRPIVDFSIENRKAVQARQKREEKSKQNNPNFKGRRNENSELPAHKHKKLDGEKPVKTGFTGTISDPKVKTLPKHSGPKIRHDTPKITRKDLRKKEQDRKNPKKRQRLEPLRSDPEQPKQKKSKTNPERASKADKKDEKENKAFDKLVNQYKNKFADNQQVIKKWFET